MVGEALAPGGAGHLNDSADPSHSNDTMETPDYYSDRKFCAHCNQYVAYLMSVERSYCAECGKEVRLFSKEDWSNFHQTMQERRPKGGRPRKSSGDKKETA